MAFQQEGEVLAHGRLRQPDVLDEVANTVLSPGQMLKHSQSCGFSEGMEEMRVDGGRGLVEYSRRCFGLLPCVIHRHMTMMVPLGDECQPGTQLIPITSSAH